MEIEPLYDPERRWQDRGSCRWADPEIFFAGGPQQVSKRPAKTVLAIWAEAKEVCQKCPVLQECRRDTLGEEFGVWGGLDQWDRFLLRRKLPKQAMRWPAEKRLAWGQILAECRDGGMLWKDITRQTGITLNLGEELESEWRAHHEALQKQAAAKVVDLPLPELDDRQPGFPDQPGRAHAWVRHNGRISDGWYRGQTDDGAWFFITTYSGRGNVNKWFRAEDVRLYQPQAVVILTYERRPDHAGDSAA
ncbi:WhiB family transcriptional regulator [Streptomyces himalayensis]|uniref:WhiB family transcriptional regulator n=1 Tax=Streptomyces himalayensis TaxID=2820085 RepID=UPI002867CA33|nr:WhiB family transcriptional regulator [Streptomyces himalayensis]